MAKDEGSSDILIGVLLGFGLVIFFLVSEPFLIVLVIPIVSVLIAVWSSGTSHRDQYFKAKKGLLLSVGALGFVIILAYYLFDSDFSYFPFTQSTYIVYAGVLVAAAFFMNWFTKKSIPISFLKDDDRIVQETMYEDYEYNTLGDTYSYRGVKFFDEEGTKATPGSLEKCKGKLTSTELTVQDLEMEALNKKDELKFYYEKVIYDMYNDFVTGGKRQDDFMQLYGYNLTIKRGIKSAKQFKAALEKESLLFYKIFLFLEKDMKNPSINIKLNWKEIYVDNLYCLEFCLISVILMLRQYMNFPVGDMAKYVKTTRDKNFLGCFSSLPADFSNINSTSISASGIAYYYIYYKLHLEWFSTNSEEVIVDRWVS